ncbi:MAG: hypothetical protein ACREQL_05100, partial [Candidatus Binatia bacterium]
ACTSDTVSHARLTIAYARRLTVRVPARLHARLVAVAAAHGLRPSEVVRVGLAVELARLERDGSRPRGAACDE